MRPAVAPRAAAPPRFAWLHPGRRAQLGELPGADVGLLEEAVREDDVDVVLRDRLRLEQDGRDLALGVVRLPVDQAGGRLLLLPERDGQISSGDAGIVYRFSCPSSSPRWRSA